MYWFEHSPAMRQSRSPSPCAPWQRRRGAPGAASEPLGALKEMAASASPDTRPDPIAQEQWQAACAARRSSCARSAVRSPSTARGGRGRGSPTSPQRQTTSRRNRRERDRPVRAVMTAPPPKPAYTAPTRNLAERIWPEAVDPRDTAVAYLRHRGVWLPDDFRGGRGIVQTGRHVPAWWRAWNESPP